MVPYLMLFALMLVLGFIGLAQAYSLHRRFSASSTLNSAYLDDNTNSHNHVLRPTLRRVVSALGACRRDNKEEKAERNRIYARRFLRKDGSSGRSATREAKRAALDARISRFAQGLFQLTSDKDDPDTKADKNVLFGI